MFLLKEMQAENWKIFDGKTYLGGYYFAVCSYCLDGRYNNDNNGYWACTDSQQSYEKGCAEGIWDAFFGDAIDPRKGDN